jgi:hypothetical protein
MTEQEYLSWTRPTAILKCLGPRATLHQCLHFLAACWRRAAEVSGDRTRQAEIALIEKVCSDEASLQDLHEAGFEHAEVLNSPLFNPAWFTGVVGILRSGMPPEQERAEKLTQVNLLRCVVGNPYTPSGIDPAWLRWDRGAIPRMAEAIHRDRRCGDLSILADALEKAGCDDSDILGHCRTRREHAYGCWVLSLLRSKLAVRLVLSAPEARLSGWRPDTAELENISAEPVSITYQHRPFERLGLLTLDAQGEVVDHQEAAFAEEASAPMQSIALDPGGILRYQLGPTRTLPPGIYTMQALFRHGGIDLRSRAFLFTVPSQA